MRNFYAATYYFWAATRTLFIIAGFISIAGVLGSYKLRTEELLANLVAVLYFIIMIYNSFLDFSGNNHNKLLKYISGSISIIIGVIILILLFTVKVVSIPAAFIFIIWIVLLGLFDILLIKRKQVTL